MIRVGLRDPGTGAAPARSRRQRFGLDAPLPADPRIVERAILRHLAQDRPDILVLSLVSPAGAPVEAGQDARVSLAAGVPDLLLVRPGGALAFLAIRTQAHRRSRAERAFADLCRDRAVPLHVVRSLPEARRVLDGLCPPTDAETHHGSEEGSVARRTP